MGGSTSVVKHKDTIQQVKPAEPEEQRTQSVVQETETVRCRKHSSSNVTHINEKTGELVCLNCYQRRKSINDDADCADIKQYTKSLKFKQLETKVIDQLRNRKITLEEELKFLDFHEKRANSKKREMHDEIQAFVSTVLELIKHMEQDLSQEVNTTVEEYTVRLKNHREYVQTWYNELLTIEKDVKDVGKTKRVVDNKALRLRSVLDAKSFVTSVKLNAQNFNETSDFKLKLNKTITLKDIVGSKNTSKDINLGGIFKESDIRESRAAEALPTIRELESSDDSLPSLELEADSSPEPITKTHATNENKEQCDDELEKSDGKPGKSRHQASVDNMSKTVDTNNTQKSFKRVSSDEITKVAIPVHNKNRMRHQFQEDRNLAGSAQRSGSPVKAFNRGITTPRNSFGSVISPISITTPSRIQLLPTRQATNSVHEKLAVKTKVMKLLTEGETPNYTDSVILDSGKIVLCDQRNERLLLLSSTFRELDQIQLKGQPHNMTKSADDSKTIAVTIPEKNIIQLIWVVGQKLEEPNKSIATKPKCRGVEYIGNNLLYTSRNDVVVVKAMNTETPWKFDYSFREPVSLCADRDNKSLFVCCIGLKSSGEVVKLNFEKEKIEQVLTYTEIKHPVCCSRDSDENLYICDIEPPRVHLVSRSGSYSRVVLSDAEGNIQHLNFFPGSDTFIVTENNSEDVHVYELQ